MLRQNGRLEFEIPALPVAAALHNNTDCNEAGRCCGGPDNFSRCFPRQPLSHGVNIPRYALSVNLRQCVSLCACACPHTHLPLLSLAGSSSLSTFSSPSFQDDFTTNFKPCTFRSLAGAFLSFFAAVFTARNLRKKALSGGKRSLLAGRASPRDSPARTAAGQLWA